MKLCENNHDMFENIVERGIDYLEKYPSIKSMIIGLSGGIDSAVTAAIAREICDRTGKHKLIGLSIPIESNTKPEIERARLAGKHFCHKFTEVKFINKLFRLFKLSRELFYASRYHSKQYNEKVRSGNIKARLRMIYLYDKAHRYNGIVLSTDNLSEYNLGFWTLHGDVGDLGFIQQLWKTEVYGLASYLCLKYEKIIENSSSYRVWTKYGDRQVALSKAMGALPTDGLGITRSDFDQIEVVAYREADDLLIEYIEGGSKDKSLEEHPVIRRHLKYGFKRENPYNIPRDSIIPKPKPVILNSI